MFSYPVSIPIMTAALSCRDGSIVSPNEKERDAVSDACPGASTKALLYYYASVPQENSADELLLPLTSY